MANLPATLWDVDIRRFGSFTGNRRALFDRTAETLGLHYAMRWPRQELETARPLRTSPLYDLLAAKNAEFRQPERLGTRQLLPPPVLLAPDYARQAWLVAVDDGGSAPPAKRWQSTTRPRSPKLLLQGVMRWRCCSGSAPTRSMYRWTAWSTPRCSTRVAALRATSRWSASRQSVPDHHWLSTNDARFRLDFTAYRRGRVRRVDRCDHAIRRAIAHGAERQALLARVSPDDLSPAALKFSWTREIDVGFARVRAAHELCRWARIRAVRPD